MQKQYSNTISELYDLQKFSIKMGLENISSLCKDLGNPQDSYPIIHIAGTNGKGSISIILYEILAAHGLRVGLYTSPHLMDFRERIRINHKFIDKKYIIDFWNRMNYKVHQLKATFFDTTTALAFEYFGKSGVDIAVIETGLGGRLDSTNIVKPVASVITPIAIDHIKQLGKNLKSIANEKAVIVKKGSTFFCARQKKTVKDIFRNIASVADSFYEFSESVNIQKNESFPTYSQFDCRDKIRNIKMEKLRLNLAGKFQIDNACLAYLVSRWYLDRSRISFSEERFRDVLSRIQWNGRLQLVSKQPDVYLDVSHNYSGFKETLSFISGIGDLSNRFLLIGLLDDKEYKLIVRLLAKNFRQIILTEPAHERALPVSVLSGEFLRYGIEASAEKSLILAYKCAIKNLGKNDRLYVMGSHFLIGEILKVINKKDLTQ
jgi:dihydrofolate synthase/folylpolyglutamate synthase